MSLAVEYRKVACPRCKAPAGERCHTLPPWVGTPTSNHVDRRFAWQRWMKEQGR